MDDQKKERKINWIQVLWIPVLGGLILLTFEKFFLIRLLKVNQTLLQQMNYQKTILNLILHLIQKMINQNHFKRNN
jgi:hypothetical protein